MRRRDFIKSLGIALAAFSAFKVDAAAQLEQAKIMQRTHPHYLWGVWELAEETADYSGRDSEGIVSVVTRTRAIRLTHGYRTLATPDNADLGAYGVDDLEREGLPLSLAHSLRECGAMNWMKERSHWDRSKDGVTIAVDEWVFYHAG